MAIFHFQAKVISRGQGRGIVAAAAYRAGERLFDHEIGRTQNYEDKPGVIHSEIMLPEGAPSRWLDRETLWNEVAASDPLRRADLDAGAGEEGAPRTRHRQLAREIEIALPRELSQAEAIRLVQDFVREQFVARGMVADLNVHWGTAADGDAQPHAHVLLTLRRVDPTGSRRPETMNDRRASRRRNPERGAGRARDVTQDPGLDAKADGRSRRGDHGDAARDPDHAADHPDPAGHHRPQAQLARLIAATRLRQGAQGNTAAMASELAGFGLKERAWNDRALVGLWRERWAEMANARLAELGHDVRIDHRSHAARGLDLQPQNKIGPAAARRARKGEDGDRTAEHRAIARANGERLLAEPELALRALTHQHSTFTRADLARLVHRQSDGAAQFAAIMAKVEASPELVRVGSDGRGRDRFSTAELVQVEARMIATAAALDKRTTHPVPMARRTEAAIGATLREEQHLAFQHVTRSRDLAVVVGIAGGGKSTMLGVARAAWEAEGYRVKGAALSGIAAEGLEGSAGIESRTIASWEYAWNKGKEQLAAGDVLVVDEAGMIGSRQLERLVRRVHEAGAKLVLVGDAEQLQAIEAGAAFRAIADAVGVVAITDPKRQDVTWMREATKELATSRTAAALTRYETNGAVHRHDTREAARDGVVALWDAARRQSPQRSRIILAHERADVRLLNEAARATRRVADELGPDHVLQTEAGERAFAVGDRLYFLRNERGLGVKNGTLATVERIELTLDGARLTVRLDGRDGAGTGRAVSFDLAEYADIDHGYAATVHKSQGVTVDEAHVLATPGMDRHLVYVAMSRHRHAAQLHWGQDEFGSRLHAVLGRERAKDTTLDYAEAILDPVAAYAERRALVPRMPDSAIVVRPAPGAAAPSLPPKPRGMFDGLQLNAAPLPRAPVPAPVVQPGTDTTPLSQALAKYMEALSVVAKMRGQGLPVLPHQEAAVQDAGNRLDAQRPGFVNDLVEVNQRQPELVRQAFAGPVGLAPLLAAVQRRPADRKAEQEAEAERKVKADAARAEFEALAPARERVLQERMAIWWQTHHPHARLSDYGFSTVQAEAKAVEAVLQAEIAKMPAAELRLIAGKLARADKLAEQETAARPGPSPSPW